MLLALSWDIFGNLIKDCTLSPEMHKCPVFKYHFKEVVGSLKSYTRQGPFTELLKLHGNQQGFSKSVSCTLKMSCLWEVKAAVHSPFLKRATSYVHIQPCLWAAGPKGRAGDDRAHVETRLLITLCPPWYSRGGAAGCMSQDHSG